MWICAEGEHNWIKIRHLIMCFKTLEWTQKRVKLRTRHRLGWSKVIRNNSNEILTSGSSSSNSSSTTSALYSSNKSRIGLASKVQLINGAWKIITNILIGN